MAFYVKKLGSIGNTFGTTLAFTEDGTLTSADDQSIVTNEGAGATVVVTLPTATVGMQFWFAVRASGQILRAARAGSDLIYSAAYGGTGRTSLEGSALTDVLWLVCHTAGEWQEVDGFGSWA